MNEEAAADVNIMNEKETADTSFRRTHRMTYDSFCDLLDLLKPYMDRSTCKKKNESSQWPVPTPSMPNTPHPHAGVRNKNNNDSMIPPPDVRLSVALLFFAGHRPCEIAVSHGMSRRSVFDQCVWNVVVAIIDCTDLKIRYPDTESHAEQKRIAQGFRQMSSVGLDKCAGALDGMLIWTDRPHENDYQDFVNGEKAFFCGKTHKFGLNMQAICDSDGKFLEVWILFPGASSDYIAFTHSQFYERLMTDGFLEDTLAIFGDNAYVCSNKLVTPYKMANTSDPYHDDFNYFHSQLRIKIKCALGMLVRRWSILRLPLSTSTLKHVRPIALLPIALCQLHNFCLSKHEPLPLPRTRALMFRQIMSNAVEFDEEGIPFGLMNAGHHCNDVIDRSITRNSKRAGLLRMVKGSGMHRVVVNEPRRRMCNRLN